MKPSLCRGQLVRWKDERGFGFIQPVDGSQEVFLHISELKDAICSPQVGNTIYYRTTNQDGKARACNAFILGAKSKLTPSSLSKTNTYPFPILEVLLLSILPIVGATHFALTTSNLLPLILYPTTSILTFILYADDKSRAKQGNRRTPEKTLHLCEFAGGWLGGFIAQCRLRHKSRKKSYQVVFWEIVVIHYIVWLGWLFFGKSIVG